MRVWMRCVSRTVSTGRLTNNAHAIHITGITYLAARRVDALGGRVLVELGPERLGLRQRRGVVVGRLVMGVGWIEMSISVGSCFEAQ